MRKMSDLLLGISTESSELEAAGNVSNLFPSAAARASLRYVTWALFMSQSESHLSRFSAHLALRIGRIS